MSAGAETKWVYDFSEGSREMRELLGGKGANVAEMTRILGPAVGGWLLVATEGNSTISAISPTRFEPAGSRNARIVMPSGPKTSSRFGERSQCSTSSTS